MCQLASVIHRPLPHHQETENPNSFSKFDSAGASLPVKYQTAEFRSSLHHQRFLGVVPYLLCLRDNGTILGTWCELKGLPRGTKPRPAHGKAPCWSQGSCLSAPSALPLTNRVPCTTAQPGLLLPQQRQQPPPRPRVWQGCRTPRPGTTATPKMFTGRLPWWRSG